MAVDYLSRFMAGDSAERAFGISLLGARRAENEYDRDGYIAVSQELLSGIDRKLDDKTIENACKLVTFDVWLRDPSWGAFSKSYNETNCDGDTIHNIRTMVKRAESFWKKYGPVIETEFVFRDRDSELEYKVGMTDAEFEEMLRKNRGGYTQTVISGDGDYLTKDTMWDFKVIRRTPNKDNTLQMLMYWIMGQHSGLKMFEGITKVGIFNPRYNVAYQLDMTNVDKEIIKEIEDKVICY